MDLESSSTGTSLNQSHDFFAPGGATGRLLSRINDVGQVQRAVSEIGDLARETLAMVGYAALLFSRRAANHRLPHRRAADRLPADVSAACGARRSAAREALGRSRT
jgi:hypothetical protein